MGNLFNSKKVKKNINHYEIQNACIKIISYTEVKFE
jgi:hypothetical protein